MKRLQGPFASTPSLAFGERGAQIAGSMLVELMVAMALAGVAIAASISALMVAREAATAVQEMAWLQQQSAYALRSIGRQVRSAGSLGLQGSAGDAAGFRFVKAPSTDSAAMDPIRGTDGGPDASDSLKLSQTSPPLLPRLQRDCLGQQAAAGTRMQAQFKVDTKSSLGCRSASGQSQPLIAGVAAFKLRYRVRQDAQVRSMTGSEVEAAQLWPAVHAVEVCLELRSEQRLAAWERQYTDCVRRNSSSAGRLVLVTRKLFLLNATQPDS